MSEQQQVNEQSNDRSLANYRKGADEDLTTNDGRRRFEGFGGCGTGCPRLFGKVLHPGGQIRYRRE